MRALLAAVLVTSIAFPAAPAQDGPFSVTFLPVHGRRQDTIVYDFTGDGLTDVVNSSIDYDADPPARWLALHIARKDGTWPTTPDSIWSVPRSASVLTFGNFVPEGGVEICTIAPDGVYYFPFENGAIVEEPRKLIHARTFFSSPSDRALPVWGWAQDLSADKRDDLVLPTPDGYRVYFQTEPGRFGKISRLEGAVTPLAPKRFPQQLEFVSSLFNLQTWLPRVAFEDIDGDSRTDIVTIQGKALHCFFQKQPGEFRAERTWTSRYELEQLDEALKKDAITYLQVTFADIDQDKLPDLVITKVEGQVGLFESLRTRIFIHFGATGRGNYEPNLHIDIFGVSVDPQFIDMNGDGKLDCLTSKLRTDLLNQAVSMGVFGDVSIEYEVFQFEPENNKFSASPVYSTPVRVTFDDIKQKGAASRPLLFVAGDLTGDGRPDQVRVNPKTDELEVHPGRAQGNLIDFDPSSHFSHKLDRYPRWIQFYDVNADGQVDMMLHHAGSVGIVLTRKRK